MAIEMARINVVRMASIHLTDISCCKNLWSNGIDKTYINGKNTEMEQRDLWTEYAHRAMAGGKTSAMEQRNNAHKGTMHTEEGNNAHRENSYRGKLQNKFTSTLHIQLHTQKLPPQRQPKEAGLCLCLWT